MVYDTLIKLIKSHLYIISTETYRHTSAPQKLERFVAKHPLLTPELIIVDDQPYGFKRTHRRLKSLEGFPIYFEITYTDDTRDEDITIESVELYSEITLSLRNKIAPLSKLCTLFHSTISADRVKRIGEDSSSSLVIYSKISELFIDHFFEDELEEKSISLPELHHLLKDQITGFTNFIMILDEILFKNKHIDTIDTTLLP